VDKTFHAAFFLPGEYELGRLIRSEVPGLHNGTSRITRPTWILDLQGRESPGKIARDIDSGLFAPREFLLATRDAGWA